MNHIKLFENFDPNLTTDIKDVKIDIENILLDLSDMGYRVSVSNTSVGVGGIGVYIEKGSTIDLEEISETIIRLYDYMKYHQSYYKRNPIMCQVSRQPDTSRMVTYSHIGWGQIDKRNTDSFNMLEEEGPFFRIIIKWSLIREFNTYKNEYLD